MNDHNKSDRSPRYVVGIGASAGGLEALRSFFASMPSNSGLAFVVVQHLAPDYKSLMVELLGRLTDMPVVRAEEGMEVKADHVYLIPPRFNLTISGGILHLTPSPGKKTLNLPIDIFFRSLAIDAAERAVAIVLSGTGSDGARGIGAVKEAGGMVMVQAEASAKFAGMPASAIATGTADFVLPVEEMPGQLVNFANHPFAAVPEENLSHIPEDPSLLERICLRLKQVVGIDFGHYKRATLVRRIERRMNISQLQDLEEYFQYLRQSSVEADALANDLLISVTKFFRDPAAFAMLQSVLEDVFRRAADRGVVRVWSAGCATGEEAYTLAMVFEEVRRKNFPEMELKIFATDLDRTALEIASAGLYPHSVVADIPRELVEKYLVLEKNDSYRIIQPLRDRMIFARQDLLADPPFTHLDLVSCRNLMIYLQPVAQRRLLSLLHFALQPKGVLFLGNSESVGELGYAFQPLDAKSRVYRKIAGVALRPSHIITRTAGSSGLSSAGEESMLRLRPVPPRAQTAEVIGRHLVERFAPATVVTDSGFQILYTVGPVSQYLALGSGPPRLELTKMVPRELSLVISTAGAQAMREGRTIEFRDVKFQPAGEAPRVLCVEIEPFDAQVEEGRLLLVTFRPDTTARLAADTLENFDFDRQLLDRVNELERELQSTRENLQASAERQETANEELQAANEELLAANEELQSTNEELESVNEELHTVNAEYQLKIQELTEANDDIENLIRSTDIGTLFFDNDLHIRRFTPAFAILAGLAPQDIGRAASTFAHPVMQAALAALPAVRETNTRHEEVIRLKGEGEFLLRVQRYRQDHSGMEGYVVSLVDISRLRDAEHELAATLETVDVGICVTDEQGCFARVNPAYCRIYGYERGELIGNHFTMVVPPTYRREARRLHDEFIENGSEVPSRWDVVGKGGRPIRVDVRASLLRRNDGRRFKITVVSPVQTAALLSTT